MDSQFTSTTQPVDPAYQLPAPGETIEGGPPEEQGMTPEMRRAVILSIIGGVLLLLMICIGVWFLLQPTTPTARIRDIFIIGMALQSILTGITLAVLMVQLARLTNVLQNEIKPILDSTNETVSNLRGTTVFLSDNLVEPVMKLNEYMAGFSQFIQVLGLMRKPRRK